MTDILEKKRIKIDYKSVIKANGLWSTFKRWSKRLIKIKSQKRKMYLFCSSFLRKQILEIKDVQYNALSLENLDRFRKLGWDDDAY